MTHLDDRAKAREIIDALPQRRHIPDERVERWLDAVTSTEPDRLVWHARRLGGIGGSEIGVVVQEAAGGRDPWSTAREIAIDKLLLRVPEPPNEHMLRGTVLEDVARAMFMQAYPVKPDLAWVAGGGVHPQIHWMRGNPDEVAAFVDSTGGAPLIVDYKVPNHVDDDDAREVMFRYVAQLHYYRAILTAQDPRYAGARLVLAPLDLEGGTAIARLAENNPSLIDGLRAAAGNPAVAGRPGFRLVTSEIDPQPGLDRAILETGEALWSRITAGELPPWPGPTDLVPLSEEARIEFERAAERLVRADAIVRAAKDEVDAARARLSGLIEGVEVDKKRAPSRLISLASREVISDVHRAEQLLLSQDIPRETFRETEYDIEALVEGYREMGGDPERFVREGKFIPGALALLDDEARAAVTTREFQVRIAGARKGPVAETLAARRSDARLHVEHVLDSEGQVDTGPAAPGEKPAPRPSAAPATQPAREGPAGRSGGQRRAMTAPAPFL